MSEPREGEIRIGSRVRVTTGSLYDGICGVVTDIEVTESHGLVATVEAGGDWRRFTFDDLETCGEERERGGGDG